MHIHRITDRDGFLGDEKPRHHSDFNSFAEAFVARRLSQHEPVSPYDDWMTAAAKERHNARDRAYAIEDAREVWEAHLDHMEDLYERGVGPAWDEMC